MKVIAIGIAVLAAVIGRPALAADMPVKALPPAPSPAPYTWTGFYLDAGAGYGIWNADSFTFTSTGAPAHILNSSQGGRGWLGTVGGGFDYQLNDRIVAGVLADFDLADISGTIQDGSPFLVGTTKEQNAWAVGARAGYLVAPSVLPYLNGGFSQARFSGANLYSDLPPNIPSGFTTAPVALDGWFVGGGVEAMVAPGWFLRTEYRYASYEKATLPEVNAAGAVDDIVTFRPYVQTVKSELVYRFNWPSGADGATSSAAAMPLKAPLAKASSTAPHNWTGLYVNAGGGYGMWSADTTVLKSSGAPALPLNIDQGGRGWLGTVGGGYDYQFSDHIVAGVLADFDFTSIKGAILDQDPDAVGTITERNAWAAGARAGYLVTPTVLSYFNGGFSQARFSGASLFNLAAPAAFSGFATSPVSLDGWFMGGGFEAMLAPNWFLRTEYRYASYGKANLPEVNVTGAPVGNAFCTASPVPAGGTCNIITFQPNVQTAVAELVYKF